MKTPVMQRLFSAESMAMVHGMGQWTGKTVQEELDNLLTPLIQDRDARVREVVQKILSCYSPDDTVNDYQDKIREFLTPPLSDDKKSV